MNMGACIYYLLPPGFTEMLIVNVFCATSKISVSLSPFG